MTTYDDPADRPTVDQDDDTEHDIRAYEDAAATIRPPKRREATATTTPQVTRRYAPPHSTPAAPGCAPVLTYPRHHL